VQVRDGLRPSRRPRRPLHEAGFEEPVPAAVLEVVVHESDIRGTDRICTHTQYASTLARGCAGG
jgi:hypothetical protein